MLARAYRWKKAAFFWVYSFHWAGTWSSVKMALTGQTGSQALQQLAMCHLIVRHVDR
jgi:hypothetical protein